MTTRRPATVLALALVALVLAGCGSTAGGASETTPPPIPAATGPQVDAWSPCQNVGRSGPGALEGFRMGAIDFTSPNAGVGLTAGSYQCFHRVTGGVESVTRRAAEQLATTDDGGRTWVLTGTPLPASRTGAARYNEAVFNQGTGSTWVVSAAGRPFVTGNDGRSWRPLPLPLPVIGMRAADGYLWALSCPARGQLSCMPVLSRLALAGPGGGWRRLALPPVTATATSIEWGTLAGANPVLSVIPPGQGRGELLISSRLGTHWRVEPVPNWDGRPCQVAELTTHGARIWLLCLGGAAAGSSTKALLTSTDGGAGWMVRSAIADLSAPGRPGQLSRDEPSALAAGSSSRLWLALTNGLSISGDGGRRWSQTMSVNGQGQATVFDAYSPTRAWLLAPGAGLWRTTDGRHWAALGPLNTG